MCTCVFAHVPYVLRMFATVRFFCANICLYVIDKYSPILVLYKSHKASSYWRVVYGAPKIEKNRKLAKLSIKLWQETLPHAKHRPTEDTQVTYHGLGTILSQYACHSTKYNNLKHLYIYRDGMPGLKLRIQLIKERAQGWLIIKI